MISRKEQKKCSKYKIDSEYSQYREQLDEIVRNLWSKGIPIKVKTRPTIGKWFGTKTVYASVAKKHKSYVKKAFALFGIKLKIGWTLF
ncbi:MAG: hypothetical protein ACXABY_07085 [Candidatus Thorarchaeota archaeon]|jgi:hypothetical protein